MVPSIISRIRNWTTLTFRRFGRDIPLPRVVAGAREGNPRCVGELYSRYRRPILALLTRIGPVDAEDVTQEVFISLPKKLATYQERGRFEEWLKRVAVNVYRTRRRSTARRREEELVDRLDENAATDPGIRRVAWQDLWDHALEGMPEPLRDAWALHIEGFEAGDIAEILEISPGAAATRLTRARSYLRERLPDLV